jgi:hypothetical protein
MTGYEVSANRPPWAYRPPGIAVLAPFPGQGTTPSRWDGLEIAAVLLLSVGSV